MGTTKIEWTDETWNVTGGCTPVSAGCLNCAAARSAQRCNGYGNDKYNGLVKGSKWTGEIRLYPDELKKPLHWKQPRRVFVDFMSDLFHPEVPFDFIDKVWAMMALCPQHTFQVLTKRPERMAEYFSGRTFKMFDGSNATGLAATTWYVHRVGCRLSHKHQRVFNCNYEKSPEGYIFPLKNVWLGTTTENQEQADRRIPHLLKCPAAKRFVSVEPMLRAVDLLKYFADIECGECDWLGFTDNDTPNGGLQKVYKGDNDWQDSYDGHDPDDDGLWICPKCKAWDAHMSYVPLHNPCGDDPRLDWVICGGESGQGARPMHPDWAKSLRDQCKAAGVPFFFKQWGKFGDAPGGVRATDVCVSVDGYYEVAGKNYVCVGNESEGEWRRPIGKKKAGSLLDGAQYKEMPK